MTPSRNARRSSSMVQPQVEALPCNRVVNTTQDLRLSSKARAIFYKFIECCFPPIVGTECRQNSFKRWRISIRRKTNTGLGWNSRSQHFRMHAKFPSNEYINVNYGKKLVNTQQAVVANFLWNVEWKTLRIISSLCRNKRHFVPKSAATSRYNGTQHPSSIQHKTINFADASRYANLPKYTGAGSKDVFIGPKHADRTNV